jgi:hypothetical protein
MQGTFPGNFDGQHRRFTHEHPAPRDEKASGVHGSQTPLSPVRVTDQVVSGRLSLEELKKQIKKAPLREGAAQTGDALIAKDVPTARRLAPRRKSNPRGAQIPTTSRGV